MPDVVNQNAQDPVVDQTGVDVATQQVPDGAPAQPAVELQPDAEAAAQQAREAQEAADAAIAEEAKKNGGLSRRFSELTQRIKAEQARAEQAERERQTALEALNRVTKTPDPAPAPAPVVEEDPEPVAPVFETPDQFQRDMADYAGKVAARNARIAVKQYAEQQAMVNARAAEQAATQKVVNDFTARVEEFRKNAPDYDEVVTKNQGVSITGIMARGIIFAPLGPAVAYHLGNNPAEASRISELPPEAQLVEIGQIAARLSAPKVVPVSRASPPIRPLNGGSSPAARPLEELSMEEYAAQRNKAGASR